MRENENLAVVGRLDNENIAIFASRTMIYAKKA
jgi:hypothetical protein